MPRLYPDAAERAPDSAGTDDSDLQFFARRARGTCRKRQTAHGERHRGSSGSFKKSTTILFHGAMLFHEKSPQKGVG
ncbi:hypothetical protein D3C83_76840 [compost metagenome]